MKSGCSALNPAAGQSAPTLAASSEYQWSRPACMATFPPVRFTTRTDRTVGQPSPAVSAASTLALRGTALPPRRPSSAVTITSDPESFTRLANDSGENPPKTTAWTAPMRVQASMATAASTIMGRYRVTRSPAFTPWARSTLAKRDTRPWSSP